MVKQVKKNCFFKMCSAFLITRFFSTYPLTDGLIMSHGFYTQTKSFHEISAIAGK